MDQASPFTELPFASPGRVFRSRMPFDTRDPQGDLFNRFLAENVEVVVLLAEDSEILECTGRDLRAEYRLHGMSVIYLPSPDFTAPPLDSLNCAVLTALDEIGTGKNLVVHCHAGMGRTGLFLACLAQRALHISAGEAIEWVRSYVPGALETPEQVCLALDYGELGC